MASTTPLTGLHHLTAVSADIRGNYRFYTRVLGMRLVKRSVNQDDVSAYHLFYADAVGSPGTDLTFFDWKLPRERRGTRSITRTYLRVTGAETVRWWAARLREHGVAAEEPVERDGRLTLDFEDPEGQRLGLVDDEGRGDPPVPWTDGPVPPERQIRGLGPVVMSVPELGPTDEFLTAIFRMRRVREYPVPRSRDGEGGSRGAGGLAHVYRMGDASADSGPHLELHVAEQPALAVARLGAGGVHHVAFRTPTEEDHAAWILRLQDLGIPNSGRVDRYYFRSVYAREPGGILFEIATDGPGFAVDEDPAALGESLALPPFLEGRREAIEANLRPIE